MKCDQCHVPMRLTKQECSGNSCSYLYECEICRKVRLTSSRVTTTARRVEHLGTGLSYKATTRLAGNTAPPVSMAAPDLTAQNERNSVLESTLFESNGHTESLQVNLGNNAPNLQPVQRLPERHHGENHYELAFELAHESSEPELLWAHWVHSVKNPGQPRGLSQFSG